MLGSNALLIAKPISKKDDEIMKKNLLIKLRDFLKDVNQLAEKNSILEDLIKKADQMLAPQNIHNVSNIPAMPITPFDELNESEERMAPPPPSIKGDPLSQTIQDFMQVLCNESKEALNKCMQNAKSSAAVGSNNTLDNIKKLEEELKSIQEAKKKLEDRNKHLERTREKLANQLDESLDAIDHLKRQLFSLEKNSTKLMENNQKLDAEKRNLEQSLKIKIEKCESIGCELKELNRKIEIKEKDIQNLAIEKKELLDILNQSDLETLAITKEKNDLLEAIKKLEKTNSELKIHHVFIEEKIKEAEENNKVHGNEKEELKQALSSKDKEIKRLEEDLELHKKKLKCLENEIKDLEKEKSHFEEKLKAIEEVINKLQKEKEIELIKKQEDIENLKINLEELKIELDHVNKLNQELEQQKQTVLEKIENMDRIHQDMSKEKEIMSVQIIKLDQGCEALKKKLESNSKEYADKFDEINQEKQNMQMELQQLQTKYSKLSHENDTLLVQLREKEDQLQKLLGTLHESQEELARLGKLLDEKMNLLDSSIEELSGNKEKVGKELLEMQNQINTLQDSLIASKEEIQELHVRTEENERYLEERIKDLEENNQTLKCDNQNLNECLSNTRQELDEICTKYNNCTQEMADLKLQNQQLKCEVDDKCVMLEDCVASNDKDKENLLGKLLQKQQELEKVNKNLNDARVEIGKLTMINYELRKHHDEKMKESDKINSKHSLDKLSLIMKLNEKDDKIAELERTKNSSNEEIMAIKEKNNGLLSELESQSLKHSIESDNLKDQLEKTEQKYENLKEKLDIALREVAKLKELNYELEKLIEENVNDLKKVKNEMKEERAYLESKVQSKELEIQNLQDKYSSAIVDITLSKLFCDELENEYEKKLQELEDKNKKIAEENEDLDENLQQKEEEINELMIKIDDMHDLLDSLQSQNQELKIENQRQISEMEEVRIAYQEEKKDLLSKLQEGSDQIDILKNDFKQEQINTQDLLKKNNMMKEEYNSQIDELTLENEKLKMENNELEFNLQKTEKIIEIQKQTEAQTYAEHVKMIEEYQIRIENLNHSYMCLTKEKNELEEKLKQSKEDNEILQNILEESQNKLEQLHIRAQDIHERFERNANQMKEVNNEILIQKESLKMQLNESLEKELELQDELCDVRAQNDELRGMNKELQEEIDYLEERLDERNRQHREDKISLLDEIHKIETELMDIKQIMVQTNEEKEKLLATHNDLLAQKASLDDELKETKITLTNEKRKLMSELEEVKVICNELQNNLQNQNEKHKNLRQLHEELGNRHSYLQEKVGTLENANSNLIEDNSRILENHNQLIIEKLDLKSQLHMTQQNIDELNVFKTKQEQELTSLRFVNSEKEKMLREIKLEKLILKLILKRKTQKITDLDAQVLQTHNTMIGLNGELNQLKEIKNKLENNLNIMKNEKDKLLREKEQLCMNISDNEEVIKTLRNDLKEKQTSLINMKCNNADLKTEKTKLIEKMKCMESEIQKGKNEISRLNSLLAENTKKLNKIQEECELSQKITNEKACEINELNSTCCKLKEQLKDLECQKHDLEMNKDDLTAKLIFREKEIDFLKINLGEYKNKFMSQSWTLQELKSENYKLKDNLQQLEKNHDKVIAERDNLISKNQGLANLIKETDDQKNELSNIIEDLKSQKSKLQTNYDSSEMASKSLLFQIEVLGLNIQSKDEQNKVLSDKLTELEDKLKKIDQINDPESKKIDYDAIMEINPLVNLTKANLKCINIPEKIYNNLNGIIGLVGLNGCGKTHILCQMNDEYGNYDLEETKNLCLKLVKNINYLVMDTKGCDEVYMEGTENEAEMNERICEFILQSYTMSESDVIVLVINGNNKIEQQLLKNILMKYPQKQLIIIHNYKDISSLQRLKKIWNKSIAKNNSKLEIKKLINPESLTYFEEILQGKKIYHLLMAKEETEAGDVYNKMSIKALNYILNQQPARNILFDPLQSIKNYLCKNLPMYLLDKTNDQPLPENAMNLCLNNDISEDGIIEKYKYKPYIFDALGRLQGTNVEPNRLEYSVLRNNNNMISYINIPQLLEETVKISIDKLSKENYTMMIEGNRMMDHLAASTANNNDIDDDEDEDDHAIQILTNNMDNCKEFKAAIPLKCSLGELLPLDQESLDIEYKNGQLMIMVPIYKDNEFIFEMI